MRSGRNTTASGSTATDKHTSANRSPTIQKKSKGKKTVDTTTCASLEDIVATNRDADAEIAGLKGDLHSE
jgi:hypothetical protein